MEKIKVSLITMPKTVLENFSPQSLNFRFFVNLNPFGSTQVKVYVLKFLKNNLNTDLVINFIFTNREKSFKFLMNNNDFIKILGKKIFLIILKIKQRIKFEY